MHRERANALAIRSDDVRIEGDHRRSLGFLPGALQRLALRLARCQCFADLRKAGSALRDRGNQPLDRLLHLRDSPINVAGLVPARRFVLLNFGVITGDQAGDCSGGEQLLGNAVQHSLLKLNALDGVPVVAGASLAMTAAAEAAVTFDHHRTAAALARHKAGQKVLGALVQDRSADRALLG